MPELQANGSISTLLSPALDVILADHPRKVLPTSEDLLVKATMQQLVTVYFLLGGKMSQAGGQPSVEVDKDTANVVPGSVSGIIYLLGKDINDPVVKMYLATQRQV